MVVLRNKAAGLCLDASLTGSGWDKSIIYPCDANNQNQQLRWDGNCLKVSNRHFRFDGEDVGFTTRGSCDLSEWKDDYTIRFNDKGNNYCVDSNGNESTSKLRLWGCNGGDYQKWLPLDWVDCNHPPNSFNPTCNRDKRHFPNLEQTRENQCNSNRPNAFSEDCTTWCNANNGKCKTRDLLNKCAKYSITDDLCNDAKITDIENKCVNMGFIDQTTKSSIGTAQCNQNSIDTFLKECNEYIPKYIPNESGCTSSGLADAKIRKLVEQNAENARLQAEKDAEATRARQKEDTDRLLAAQKESDIKRQEELNRVSKEQIDARKASQEQMELTLLSIVDPDSLPDNLKQRIQPTSFTQSNMIYIILFVIIFMILILSLLYNLSD